MMKNKRIVFVLLLAIGITVFLAACNDETDNALEDEDLDIEQLVHDYSVGSFKDVSATITSTELIVTDDKERETTYDLPEDKFFVSIAPFINETHPCANHSLTGCQGEMVEEEFDIEIRDSKGEIVIDENMETMENGFIDLWLPRDENFSINISHNGKMAESSFSTYEGDNTCITTIQL